MKKQDLRSKKPVITRDEILDAIQTYINSGDHMEEKPLYLNTLFGDRYWRGIDLGEISFPHGTCFVGLDLQRVSFRKCNLVEADFTDCKLQKADFEAVDAPGINLTRGRLTRADLRGSKMPGAICHGAYFQNTVFGTAQFKERVTDFTGADFTGADLRKTTLTHASLYGCNMSEAKFQNSEQVENMYVPNVILDKADMRGANLKYAFFCGASLVGTKFKGADLTNVNLSGARCKDADFRGTNLSGANFSGADLRGTDFEGASLYGTWFLRARMQGVRFRKVKGYNSYFMLADLKNAKFDDKETYLRNCNFSGAIMQGINAEKAWFIGCIFHQCNLSGGSFRKANLNDCKFKGCDGIVHDGSRTVFIDAELRNAKFSFCDLADVMMGGADLTGATLTYVDISHGQFNHAFLDPDKTFLNVTRDEIEINDLRTTGTREDVIARREETA